MREVYTTREHIELVRSVTRDHGKIVGIEFKFAAPVSGTMMESISRNVESPLNKVIESELRKKGWVSADGKRALTPIRYDWESGPDGKTWTFRFRQNDPDKPSSKR